MTSRLDAPTARTYRFGPPDRRAVLLGLRAPQVAVLAAAVLLAVTVLMAVPSGVGLLLALVAAGTGAAVAFAPVRGRSVDEWAPVLGRWAAVSLLRRRVWTSPVPLIGDTADTEVAEPPPPLTGISILRTRHAGSGEKGVIHDRARGAFSAVVACRGQPFALLERAEQDRLAGLWGHALASLAHDGSPIVRLSWVERTLPEEGDALEAYLSEHGVLAEDHPARASYAELIAEAGPATQTHETYVALTLGARRARRAVAQAGGGVEGACEVLLRELDTLVDRLRQAEIDVEEQLSPRRLAALLRGAFDPTRARSLLARGRLDPPRAGVAGRNGWPLATEIAWGHYRADASVHATYWVAELPRRDVDAAFLYPLLLRSSGVRAVAAVAEPVPPSRALRAVESAHASHVADDELRARAGYLPSARRRKEHEALLAREAELADGHAEYRFSAYVTVSAPDLDTLEYHAGEIEQLGFDAGCELRRLYGVQDLAFTYTLPLGRGLR